MPKCRWSSFRPTEECSRARAAKFDFCQSHVERLVEYGLERHPDFAKSKPEGPIRRLGETFLKAIIGAGGALIVEHWDSVYVWLDHLVTYDFMSVGRTRLPVTPDRARWYIYGHQEASQERGNSRRRVEDIDEVLEGTEEEWLQVGREVWSRIGTPIQKQELEEYRDVLNSLGLSKRNSSS